MSIGPEIIGLVVVLGLLGLYIASVGWAVGDAQKRGYGGTGLVYMFYFLGPLAALIWLVARPGARLAEKSPKHYDNAEDALSAATKLDRQGDWDEALALYRSAGQRWPEHSAYVQECIARIKEKQSLAGVAEGSAVEDVYEDNDPEADDQIAGDDDQDDVRGEPTTSGSFVELARYPSSAEAAIVRGRLEEEGVRCELYGEAVASWFWHFGPAIGGVRLLVSRDDVDRARKIIEAASAADESQMVDFDDEAEEDEGGEEEPAIPEELTRAWRASLIGFFLLPPLLNLYSTWLLVRHGLFLDRTSNWRIFAACSANLIVFAFAAWIILMIAAAA